MNSARNITGIILAGGKSSRMGSDKGFLQWKGRTFIEHILGALRPVVNEILIVSNNKAYDILGHTRLNDAIHNAGPLAGLYTGLKESKTHLNLVVSCDVPLITAPLWTQLIAHYQKGDNAVVYKDCEKTMPLIGLYTKECECLCLRLLERDERRMMQFLKDLNNVRYMQVEGESQKQIRNINTLADLKEIENEY
ncbi:MAG: molybdenum cofactor guanylyltransferase [Bacteroidota bacterium]